MSDLPENNVDEYIAQCPKNTHIKLAEIRAAIQEVAPNATERTDYFQIPGYSYEGFDYNGMFVWFSYKKPNLCIHVRPPVIQQHRQELKDYATTKSIVSFPADKALPIALIQKLVTASLNAMKGKA